MAEDLEDAKRMLIESIAPLKKRARPHVRQLNIPITEEEHEILKANALAHGVTMRDLLMTAIRPALTRLR
jgi:hypothetical protein